ncbi:transcriptional regulator [Paenibacillus sp. 598K]|uniref:helix-turn-helix domain-containing protein n=1 Tax=Paenibacillus sp. 598K TaxID=1117987 RepID=UPI000FFAB7CA|nr:helix-turn-helix transcriptional regulator [Paenibacillus sp. 598K]GBF73091.1 transcriptional regulator [Paenibacillus sp. 598K]
MELHEKIRIVRTKKRFTQSEIAKKANMPLSTYNMKETGKRTIRPDEFEVIAEALNERPEIFYSKKFHEKWNSDLSACI